MFLLISVLFCGMLCCAFGARLRSDLSIGIGGDGCAKGLGLVHSPCFPFCTMMCVDGLGHFPVEAETKKRLFN